MAKYLLQASYLVAGVNGLLKEGGTARKATVEKLAQSMGGSLEVFYYGFGDNDVYAIVDVPDEATMIALSLAVNGTGALSLKTTVLVEPEVIDEASAKAINYRSPGQ